MFLFVCLFVFAVVSLVVFSGVLGVFVLFLFLFGCFSVVVGGFFRFFNLKKFKCFLYNKMFVTVLVSEILLD